MYFCIDSMCCISKCPYKCIYEKNSGNDTFANALLFSRLKKKSRLDNILKKYVIIDFYTEKIYKNKDYSSFLKNKVA